MRCGRGQQAPGRGGEGVVCLAMLGRNVGVVWLVQLQRRAARPRFTPASARRPPLHSREDQCARQCLGDS
jgi:hypothetical protein